MTRFETIKAIGKLYNIIINNSDIKHVGIIHNNKKNNPTFTKIMNIYNLLIYNLYINDSRLKDVKNIYYINNIIYYDLEFLHGCELCNK